MIKFGNTTVSMKFDSGRYKGMFSVTHPALEYPARFKEELSEELVTELEIAVALVVQSILKNGKR